MAVVEYIGFGILIINAIVILLLVIVGLGIGLENYKGGKRK